MSQARQKFATQVNSEILASVRRLAEKEGRQLQALVEEALTDLIEKHKNARPRPHVMGVPAKTLFPSFAPPAAARKERKEAAGETPATPQRGWPPL